MAHGPVVAAAVATIAAAAAAASAAASRAAASRAAAATTAAPVAAPAALAREAAASCVRGLDLRGTGAVQRQQGEFVSDQGLSLPCSWAPKCMHIKTAHACAHPHPALWLLGWTQAWGGCTRTSLKWALLSLTMQISSLPKLRAALPCTAHMFTHAHPMPTVGEPPNPTPAMPKPRPVLP
jgi:hypothetical protein